ncbi:hypothetical protein PVNG_05974 [Plasmodium vivax North Korean]|uniref:VIR protein n=1 Tax=Plasmodium vivax North Korean TaxID=1035514 RepID=A0A0J9WF13_PLAVI|nr:hypothetical protein PVNG_05974 [Plasmodium vivax North Korean]
MYSNFDEGQSGCENIHFYSSIKDEIRDSYPSIRIISEKILKALCFIYNEKTNLQNKLDDEYCSYLYYWLGHNILQYLSNKSQFQKIIKMIYQDLYYSGMNSKCNYLYDNINEKTFNTYKLLFDYSKDHGNINLSTYHGYTTCDEHYKKVMNDYINTYRDVYNNCIGKNEKNYDCIYFNKLFKEDQYEKLTTFTCRERRYDSAISELPKPRVIQPAASVRVSPAEVANLYVTPSPTYHRNLVRNDQPQSYLRPYSDKKLADHHRLNEKLIHPVEESTEGGSSKTIAGSVVPVLGVSSISLLLYKVTPIGGFINKLLGRNSNMYNNIEYTDAFNPYNDGMLSGDRRMNISYHRL